jgi:hypothetical protein
MGLPECRCEPAPRSNGGAPDEPVRHSTITTPTTRTIGEPIEWDWYFVKRRHLPIARRGLSIALGVLAVILPLQGFIGDSVVAYVAKYKTPQFEAQEGKLEAQHRLQHL